VSVPTLDRALVPMIVCRPVQPPELAEVPLIAKPWIPVEQIASLAGSVDRLCRRYEIAEIDGPPRAEGANQHSDKVTS
jgi:hypothetical protein